MNPSAKVFGAVLVILLVSLITYRLIEICADVAALGTAQHTFVTRDSMRDMLMVQRDYLSRSPTSADVHTFEYTPRPLVI